MRKTLTTALAAAACIPLAFLAAVPAAAAPGDSTVAFSSTSNLDGGNTVTALFTSTQGGYAPTYCGFAESDPNGDVLIGGMLAAESGVPGNQNPTLTVVNTDVADGTYTIEWFCYTTASTGNSLVDGTPGFASAFGESQMRSEPVILSVGSADPICSGSACLPTGSSFFGL